MNARYRFWMNVSAGALVVFLLSLGAAVWQVLYCVWPSALVSLGPLVPLVGAVALGMVYVATHLADEEGGR